MKSFTYRNAAADASTRDTPDAAPTACPACQSLSISTTARHPDENAYWRCSGCGEVWNASRRAARKSGAWR
jgi:hypothetical protein